MSRILFVILSLYLISVFLYSCKKYDEGPSFTLLTKKQRLKGDWILKSVDGDASMSFDSYTDSMYTNCGTYATYTNKTVYQYYRLEFEKDGDLEFKYSLTNTIVDYWATQATCTAVYDETEITGIIKGDWDFEDGKEDIEFTLGNTRTEYEILRLTKNELKLETLTGEVWEFEKD